jgi:PhnB protein
MNNQTIFTRDLVQKRLLVTRDFDASLELVWRSWTDSEILDQWWIPEPYKAQTKTMNFTEGGYWHFAVTGPDMQMWGRMDFTKIVTHNYFTVIDCFCDANAVPSTDFPATDVKNTFRKTNNGTTVEVEVTFASEADMIKITEMGGFEGFTASHLLLDKLLEKMIKAEKSIAV